MSATGSQARRHAVAWSFAVMLGTSALPVTALASPAVDEGLALLEDWQLEDALALAKQLLHDTPDDPEVWMLAGRVQHQRGEHLSALALLDAARAAGVDTGWVHANVASSAEYAAHFDRVDTKHFSIRYLNKDEIVARYAAPVLEAAYANIGGALGLLPAERGEPIVVEIYPDARGLAGATGLTVGEIAASGTIAVCKFHRLMITSPLATADGYAWADTIAHEFTHLVISKRSHNGIPIWLHEGIAKYYESLWKGPAGADLEPFSEKLLAEAARKRDFITFDQMNPSMAKLPTQQAAALAFAEVFTTIEFLNRRYGPKAIPKVLALVGEGVRLEAAFERVFELNLEGIESAWRRYLAKRKFTIVPGAKPQRITLATAEGRDRGRDRDKEKPLETITEREVHDYSRLGEMLQLRGQTAAAVIEYEKAYARAGMKYATLIYRLAQAYVGSERSAEALELLDNSLRIHPDSSDSHLLAGRLRLKRKDYDAARADFEAVRLQNPFNPEIHLALRELYSERGDTDDAAQEARMLDLSRKPRPTRTYLLPSPPAGNAHISIITPRWDAVRIDAGAPRASPTWDLPIEAGHHAIEYHDAAGATQTKELTISIGDDLRLVLE